jgi:hypothetical protein
VRTKSSDPLNLKEKEGHQCQEWAASDISYVSDTFQSPIAGYLQPRAAPESGDDMHSAAGYFWGGIFASSHWLSL